MPLSPSDRDLLESLGVDNVRQRLDHASPTPGSVVPLLGLGFGMVRSDVEEWLAEKGRHNAKLPSNILWWAKAAIWVGVVALAIATVVGRASGVLTHFLFGK
jgi:hypothetical protein